MMYPRKSGCGTIIVVTLLVFLLMREILYGNELLAVVFAVLAFVIMVLFD